MTCECPKGKKAFTAVHSLSFLLEDQYAEGQCPDTLLLVDLLMWNEAVSPKAGMKKASGLLSDIFIQTLY